ncbi:hypothetical protein [Acinetobacter chinensis]|uniref:hypothetical protein n=1 Tax=Acinetobacter chinensis TaxID=2004650 RepID=UPI002934FF0E|nr:hypothetical protein [Acinetobacter chinensis]WOE40093.1 hypothetical protein QSG87_09220 [Acinetobacter chinensis]
MIDNTLILALTDIIQLPEAEGLQAIKDKFSDKSLPDLLQLVSEVLAISVSFTDACREALELHLVTVGDVHPHTVEKLIMPTFHGALNGLILAQKVQNQEVLCESCAYRPGTLANYSLGTQSDLSVALSMEKIFFCHKDIENHDCPSLADRKRMKPCKGWAQHVKQLNCGVSEHEYE